jgi:hypothetical protein
MIAAQGLERAAEYMLNTALQRTTVEVKPCSGRLSSRIRGILYKAGSTSSAEIVKGPIKDNSKSSCHDSAETLHFNG